METHLTPYERIERAKDEHASFGDWASVAREYPDYFPERISEEELQRLTDEARSDILRQTQSIMQHPLS